MPKKTKEQKNNLQTRPPVVVVLGHVDHGKSSLLEAIREDFVITSKESGGITQHVGAYEIEHQEKKITFIDTPGHEAFSAIRSRGARAADIAILVVAADEGVKTQTKEAIEHIKKAEIPVIVAINKMDKPAADPERVKRELQREDITVESIGGKVPSVNISAKTDQGVSDLLDMVLLVAEMENLQSNPSKPAEGVVIETRLNPSRGPTATLLVTDGTLRLGNVVGTPSAVGKVKMLENFQGKNLTEALVSMPVTALGFETLPRIGDKFQVYGDLETAKSAIQKQEEIPASSQIAEGTSKDTLNLILKADVAGSLEAIMEMLKAVSHEKIGLRILKNEVGPVNESDVKLAKGSQARIVAFRVKTEANAQNLAERTGVRAKNFDVIYELVQYVREMMEKMVKPELTKIELAKIKILVVFLTDKKRQIVGGKVVEGEVKKGARIEVVREEKVLGRGKMLSLQRNKKDIESAKRGEEVGILYEGETRIEEGDILVIFFEEFQK